MTAPSFAPIVLALAAVLALIPVALWLLRRMPGNRATPAGGLQLVAQLPLGAGSRVVVLEAGQRWLVLGVTAASITRLGTLPKGESPAGSAPAFAALLDRTLRGKG